MIEASSPFRGVFPALITPMTADDRLDEEALREVMEYNIQAGVQGFWVAGGSGESILLDDDENRRIASIAADQARGRAALIMHVGAATTRRAAALAENAAAAGVEAICCVPPFFYGRAPDEIVEHYRAVAAAADRPLFAYNLPGATGVEVTPDLLKRTQDKVSQLVGLKHSSMNLAVIREFTRLGLSCFTGSSALMLPALTLGACGCVDGPPNVAPEPWVELWRAYGEGDLRAAEAAQARAREVIDLCVMFSGSRYHAALKALLSHRLGLECGAPRRPALPLSPEQRSQLAARADELGLGPLRPTP
ncbi:MAG: dihydrodipicolinate synthase family protein [Gemmatimonadota bacterium]